MNKYIIIGAITFTIVIGVFTLTRSKEQNNQSLSKELIPINSITHGHGLSTDPKDSSKLYIATHHGLILLKNDKDLFQVGETKDDYMGFSSHPSESEVFYSSGHPEAGGNLGFQKSTDGGYNWTQISNVENDPVDFHAMGVSRVNPDLVFGWTQGKLYRSINAGKDWKAFPTKFLVTSIVTDSSDENMVYALSSQGSGVLVSKNKGESFIELSDQLSGGIVSSLAINPADNKEMLSFSEKIGGLGISNDAGLTWEKLNEEFNGEEVLFISYSKPNPNNVYALTHLNSIYKSLDGGNIWMRIK